MSKIEKKYICLKKAGSLKEFNDWKICQVRLKTKIKATEGAWQFKIYFSINVEDSRQNYKHIGKEPKGLHNSFETTYS